MHILNVAETSEKKEFSKIYEILINNAVKIITSKCSSRQTIYISENKKVVTLKNLCDRRMCDVCGKYMYIRLTSNGRLKPCLSRKDTEIKIPIDLHRDTLERCFLIAINNMGNGLDEFVDTGLSLN